MQKAVRAGGLRPGEAKGLAPSESQSGGKGDGENGPSFFGPSGAPAFAFQRLKFENLVLFGQVPRLLDQEASSLDKAD